MGEALSRGVSLENGADALIWINVDSGSRACYIAPLTNPFCAFPGPAGALWSTAMKIFRFLILALLCLAGAACASSPSGPYNVEVQPVYRGTCTPIYPGGAGAGTIRGADDCGD